jgi:hypothetical protein
MEIICEEAKGVLKQKRVGRKVQREVESSFSRGEDEQTRQE